jgi:lipoprotein-anchoring transpeptidase ErfK/SrfK
MPRRRKYKPVNERPGIPSILLWMLGLSCLALFLIYGWRAGRLGPAGSIVPFEKYVENKPAPAAGRSGKAATWGQPDPASSGTGSTALSALKVSLPATLAPAIAPRPVENDFETQLALLRRGLSPGSLDGVMGPQTRAALRAFQQAQGLAVTGALDEPTRARLLLDAPPYVNYVVTAEDVARLRPLSSSWLGKSQQDRLDYGSILELVSEKGRAYPNYIRNLNPTVDWTRVEAGSVLKVPYAYDPEVKQKAAFVKIFLADRVLQAFDDQTNLMAHFPCSIARQMEKRPLGELHVAVIVPDPNYTFNPVIFPESAEGRELGRKLVIPPGPNNPVGVAWIGLDRPGYGIHGTPEPEKVGRTESHGCFRLANWNAQFLTQLVWLSMPVFVEP